MVDLQTAAVSGELELKQIVDILSQLNIDNPVDWSGDLNELYARNISASKLQLNSEDVLNLIPLLNKYNPDDKSEQWKYICLNFHYLSLLKGILEGKTISEYFSVQQINQLKNVIRNIIGIGIRANLLPNLPYYIKLPSDEKVCATTRYKRLIGTTYGICTFLTNKANPLKILIIPTHVTWILSAFYQIIYCPLKKPNNVPDESGFIMTNEIYNSAMGDRQFFKCLLKDFSSAMHIAMYVRETMMLLYNKSLPTWLKRAVSSSLSLLIRSPKGVETIACAMLEAAGLDDPNDTARSWKTIDIIAKIVMDSRKLPDFRENVCKQLNDLCGLRDRSGEPIKPFERLFSLCTKLLFQQDELLCQEVFIKHLLQPLICFTNEEYNMSNDVNITESVSQAVRLLHSLVVERNFNIPVLPLLTITPIINVIFRVYAVTVHTSALQELNDYIKNILRTTLQEGEIEQTFLVFDNFLFGIYYEQFLELRPDIEFVLNNNCLHVKRTQHAVELRPSNRVEILKHLLKEDLQITTTCFTYLLNRLIQPEKYFQGSTTNQDLLHLETDIVLPEAMERKYAVYKLLSELAEDKRVQKHISENPLDVIRYIHGVFVKTIDAKTHKTTDLESEGSWALFTIVMILQGLVENASVDNLNYYKDLVQPLEIICRECNNREMKELAKVILSKITGGVKEKGTFKDKSDTKTPLDIALEDISDPLLPVRGHGLMMLAKLVENKDECVLERKQYILNIFQQNLKNEDSYIYLNAVGGLAALGDIFPDMVLKVLAEEYSDCSRRDSEDGHEVRLKVGEVLVRVTKVLGDMAPKYKALLLNTFLGGTKDEDHLIRASSLSNLGEVCRVLGYKLGTIVTEVLVCVHAIITTDKAAEARRAAVTVIRQLFVGLEKEMIVVLKDEILPVYRTLKHIYYHDSDNVMRLQAQLALEQLNENMKEFIFPNPRLHAEKKIDMLN